MRPCAPVAVWQPKPVDGFEEVAVVGAAGFDFEESQIGAALLLQVAESGDVAVFENQHLVAALLHVAQQVRGEDQAQVAAIADILNELDHAGARGRIEAVGRLVEEQQFGSMGDGRCQFGGLLHAERICAQRPVAHLAQANVKEGFMRALQGLLAAAARKVRPSCGQSGRRS